MNARQLGLNLSHKRKVVLFAGGGGQCEGIQNATGDIVDVAVNHDRMAVAMHKANHPQTRHFTCDVFEVDPFDAVGDDPIGLLHASPDCTHHSQARGGQPRSRVIRALSWVVHRWAGKKHPDVITLENVEQILQWSPLVAKRDPTTGRVLRIDGTVAGAGERVPVDQQFLVPCQKRKGKNWQHFVGGLRRMGYAVQWKTLCAADYGAPTTRSRLFMIARCDGHPIVWPEPTHAKKPTKGQKPWRSAAECIDWSIPCPSIFERKKDLAEATLRRIARGIRKYVLDSGDPFIVPITHTGGDRVHGADEPLRTITTAHRGELAAVAPTLVQAGYGEREGQAPRSLDIEQPLGTVVAGGIKHAVAAATLIQFRHDKDGKSLDLPLPTVTAGGASKRPAGAAHAMGLATAYLAQQNGGFNDERGSPGHDARRPLTTISSKGAQQQVVAAMLSHAYTSNTCGGEGDPRLPTKTITTGGHHSLVECTLSPDDEAGALRVAAFLMHYYSEGGQAGDLRDPAATITTKDRLALVTVVIRGTPYVIVDIGLRMLQPRELFNAQSFRPTYVIDWGIDPVTGERVKLTKSQQVRMCGNSVPPVMAEAITRANCCDPVTAKAVA